MILTVKTTPNASHTHIKRYENDILYVAVAAPAQDGQANETLLRFLIKFLQVPATDIKILSGKTARLKKIRLPLSKEALLNFL